MTAMKRVQASTGCWSETCNHMSHEAGKEGLMVWIEEGEDVGFGRRLPASEFGEKFPLPRRLVEKLVATPDMVAVYDEVVSARLRVEGCISRLQDAASGQNVSFVVRGMCFPEEWSAREDLPEIAARVRKDAEKYDAEATVKAAIQLERTAREYQSLLR